MVLMGRRYTLAEFLELLDEAEQAFNPPWYELIEGELVIYASPNNRHMLAATALLHYLGDARLAVYGQEGTDRSVALDYPQRGAQAQDIVKPDAFFVTLERRSILDVPDVPSVGGAPDIVVEVISPRTGRFDRPPRGQKFRAYQRSGVRFYWPVDLPARTIRQFERRDGHLVEVAALRPGDLLGCPLFPELALPVAHIFP